MREVGMFCHGSEMKVDLGGGQYPRSGYINVDLIQFRPGDIVCNFNSDKLPFDDNSVDKIFSSHCFEHINNLKHLVNEIVRIGKPNAEVEVWTPHWTNPMAMCYGHKFVWSEKQWEQITTEFKASWFDLSKGHIKLDKFLYSELHEIQLPHMKIQYYHDFCMLGKVVK